MSISDFLNKHKGSYTLKSPYHKDKRLPFKIIGQSFDTDHPIECSTVEYKGWTAIPHRGGYAINVLLDFIKSGLIIKCPIL